MCNQKPQLIDVPGGSIPMPPGAGECCTITYNPEDFTAIQTDADFQIESYDWINSIRGPEYLTLLAHGIDQLGPEVVLAEVIHPTMCSDEKQVYRAAIEYLNKRTDGSIC